MRNAIFFVLWLLYYAFFWQEGMGLNLFIFALLLNFSARFFQSEFHYRKGEWSYIVAFGLSAIGLLWLNSAISIFSFILINIAYLSFIWGPELSVMEHFGNGFIRLFNFTKSVLPAPIVKGSPAFGGVYSVLKLSLLPLAIFGVFFSLFRAGNPIFKEWSNGFTALFGQLFADFSWAMFWFLILGVLILRMVFLSPKSWPLVFQVKDKLQRRRLGGKGRFFKINALRREYRMALMVFASLNGLLLTVNLIDIRWFWFGFEMPQNFSLKEFLHEGVAFLIASLLLAAAVVFYYFRNNLNFYPGKSTLKVLAKIWIVQNAILSISVLLRTYYYIDFHGLANGRITVITIISIVLVGLYLLFRKVNGSKSHAYVFRYVSLYTMLLLAGMSVWDWDQSIAKHNLAHGRINEIDVDNYLRLHPRVYPLIMANLDRVETQIEAHVQNEEAWIRYRSLTDFQTSLVENRQDYLELEAKQSWLSWNYSDAKAVAYLGR